MGSLPPKKKPAGALSIEQAEYRVVWEDGCEKTPPCTDLLSDPKSVLENKERWPGHLCYAAFQRQSTELWAAKSVGVVTQVATKRWMGTHPLPIGREAVMYEGRFLGDSGEEGNLNGLEELFNIVPFDGREEAIWALRIEQRLLAAVHTLDLWAHRIPYRGAPGGRVRHSG